MARRGRLKAEEVAARRAAVVEAALAELITHGYQATTMLAVAKRAEASKETLYSWFGDKHGLFSEVISHQAGAVAAAVAAATSADSSPRDVLERFGVGLLQLLLGPPSIALNRAAMSDLSLAETLLLGGRYTAGPIVEKYLAGLAADNILKIDDPAIAFETLYGLVVRDLQIRVLLGEEKPSLAELQGRTKVAIDEFLRLHSPDGQLK